MTYTPIQNVILEGRRHLSAKLPGHQIFWDATSISSLKKCPRYYYYSMLCGYRPKRESIHLTFGSLYHYGLEYFDRQIVAGKSHDEAVHAMVKEIHAKTADLPGDDPKKNRETLLRTLVWYTEEYRHDNFQTYVLANGEAAVELSFRTLLPFYASTGEQYGGCGHFDKVATMMGGLYILDKKTSGSTLGPYYFENYTPDVQMTWYSLAGQIVLEKPISGVVVDAVQLAVGFSRFARGIVARSKGSLEEFLGDLKDTFDQAEFYAQRQSWPMNQTACVSGDTVLRVQRGKCKGSKYTIAKLHDLLTGKRRAPMFNSALPTYVMADVGGEARAHRLIETVYSGVKQVFKVTTACGKSVKATADHKFKTPVGWVELQDLKIGEHIIVWNGLGKKEKKKEGKRKQVNSVPYHPHASAFFINGINYKRTRRSRLVYEAGMNGISYEEFLRILRKVPARAKQLKYLDPAVEVHHKDENPENDALDNLEALRPEDHREQHAPFSGIFGLDTSPIVSIEPCGEEAVYDLVMDDPHHTFLANDIVVHNCDKYGGCAFRKICGADPAVRGAFLKADFKVEPWNPLESR